jgi:hypothetical protein
MNMTSNIGAMDRVLRAVLGLVVIALGFYFGTWWGALGAVLLVTAAINWCPIYAVLGVSTCPVKR